jgi:hypothetical protein
VPQFFCLVVSLSINPPLLCGCLQGMVAVVQPLVQCPDDQLADQVLIRNASPLTSANAGGFGTLLLAEVAGAKRVLKVTAVELQTDATNALSPDLELTLMEHTVADRVARSTSTGVVGGNQAAAAAGGGPPGQGTPVCPHVVQTHHTCTVWVSLACDMSDQLDAIIAQIDKDFDRAKLAARSASLPENLVWRNSNGKLVEWVELCSPSCLCNGKRSSARHMDPPCHPVCSHLQHSEKLNVQPCANNHGQHTLGQAKVSENHTWCWWLICAHVRHGASTMCVTLLAAACHALL